jgi:hydrogenase-4 component E
MMLVKGLVIPRLLLKAMHEADVRPHVDALIGFVPSLLAGAVGTALALVFARTLLVGEKDAANMDAQTRVVAASLATVLTGFLLLTTRRQALAQILGYLVLENGIFIFGLLLIQAMPILVEVGVLLDVFVGVFVMGIIVNHVSREFPSASSEHLSMLRE